jgi:hypothetical protein
LDLFGSESQQVQCRRSTAGAFFAWRIGLSYFAPNLSAKADEKALNSLPKTIPPPVKRKDKFFAEFFSVRIHASNERIRHSNRPEPVFKP